MREQQGYTLLEIAIVLMIIGLFLGGVLKVQELIVGARVRNLITQHDDIKAAYSGFRDRYRALPGDYSQATANITGIAATPACGNGNGDGDGRITTNNQENVLVWEHLSKAGFISGTYTCAAVESNATTPTNPFAVRLQLTWDDVYAPTAQPARHSLKTGSQIPSGILAEVDRKIDDDSATGGAFRFSAYDGGGAAPAGSGTCYLAATPNQWASGSAVANCGATNLF